MSRISLKVKAGARKTGFAGRFGDAWKLNVAAPPVDGKANDEIVRFLSKLFRVPVRIVTGQTSANKLMDISGLDIETLERVILESNGSAPHSGSSSPRKT